MPELHRHANTVADVICGCLAALRAGQVIARKLLTDMAQKDHPLSPYFRCVAPPHNRGNMW